MRMTDKTDNCPLCEIQPSLTMTVTVVLRCPVCQWAAIADGDTIADAVAIATELWNDHAAFDRRAYELQGRPE